MRALLLLWACAGPSLMDPMSPPEVDLQARLTAKRSGPGEAVELILTQALSPGWAGEVPEPAVEGLQFKPIGEEIEEEGGRTVIRRRYAVEGSPDSYVIPPLTVRFDGPGDLEREISTSTLFLDLGVDGPTSELEELALAPAPPPPRWPYAAAAVALLAAGGGFWLWRRRRAAAEPPLLPHEVLLRGWAEVRDDEMLDDEARAIALSSLFRAYLSQVSRVEATSLTTLEVMRALEERALWPEIRQECQQILSATDLVKYAREGGGRAMFQVMDASLQRVVERTRPREVAADVA